MTTQQILTRLIVRTDDSLIQSALLDSLFAVRRAEWVQKPVKGCLICGGWLHSSKDCVVW